MEITKFIEDNWRDRFPCVAKLSRIKRCDAARFLGLHESDMSDCCSLLLYPPKTKLTVAQVFGIYLLYAYQRNIDENLSRKNVAMLLLSEARTTRGNRLKRDRVVENLDELDKGLHFFLRSFEAWLDGRGEPLSITGEQKPGLKRHYKLRKARQNLAESKGMQAKRTYNKLPLYVAAKLCSISADTCDRYLSALRDANCDLNLSPSGHGLTAHDFCCLWALCETVRLYRDRHNGTKGGLHISEVIILTQNNQLWNGLFREFYGKTRPSSLYRQALKELSDRSRPLKKAS